MTLCVTSPRNKTWKKVKGENKKCHCSENRQRKVFEVGNQWLRDTSHRGGEGEKNYSGLLLQSSNKNLD